jgi:flap endonuclease-1
MGVAMWEQIPRRKIGLEDLAGHKIALDAFNTIYYFLTVIRHRTSGEPLKDHEGHITSHLSGLLYRTVTFLEVGIKPVYVFNGRYPGFEANMQKEGKRKAANEGGPRTRKAARNTRRQPPG